MRSFSSRALGAFVALGTVGLAACSDAPIEPRRVDAAPQLSVTSTSTSTSTSSSTGGTSTVSVTVSPTSSATISVNGHTVNIPAGAICDRATSGYGPAYWDAPCTVSQSVTIQAKAWTDASGKPRVAFYPDVRFAPGKVVTMSLKATKPAAAASLKIDWCPTGSENAAACVDEAKTDASLATRYDAATGRLTRRVKHFSGYMVSVGLTGEGSDTTGVDLGIQ